MLKTETYEVVSENVIVYRVWSRTGTEDFERLDDIHIPARQNRYAVTELVEVLKAVASKPVNAFHDCSSLIVFRSHSPFPILLRVAVNYRCCTVSDVLLPDVTVVFDLTLVKPISADFSLKH